jgi:hypothetical protein
MKLTRTSKSTTAGQCEERTKRGLLRVPLAAAEFDVKFFHGITAAKPVCVAFEAALACRRELVPRFRSCMAAASGTQDKARVFKVGALGLTPTGSPAKQLLTYVR